MTRARQWRLFTVAEADAVIDRLEPLLTTMATVMGRLADARARLAGLTTAMRSNGSAGEADRLEAAVSRLAEELAEIVAACEALGVETKDVAAGIVDFPARHEGRVVLLCYRRGEGRIVAWHEVDDGYAGRRPISQLDDEALGSDES